MSEPLFDIIMLVSNQPTWASIAIKAVEQHTTVPYRLIIVDQATTHPDFKAVLDEARQRGHTVLRMAENRSFSNGNNAGARVGNAKFICVLNDDTVVCNGWSEALIQDLSDKTIGLVGARTNYAAGPTGDPSWDSGIEPPFMAFVCVATRREIWEQVGGLDEENFTGFSSEDLDLCWRIKKLGYKLRVSRSAYVLHAGSRSITTFTSGGSKDAATVRATYNAHNEKYMRVLEEKWGKDFVAANTKLRQKVLVVSYHAEEWTRVRFAGSLLTLKAGSSSGAVGGGPDGGNFGFTYYQHVRTPIHLARQLVADYATNNDYDVLVQLDDDAADLPHDLIRRFLSHGKDVVTALAYQRKPPYLPCIYELVAPDAINGNPLVGWEHTGLRRVDISGFHCSMIKTDVFKRMRAVGIKEYYGGFEKAGEDFLFSANLRKIGVPLYCDTDLIVGHIAEGPVINEEYRRKFLAGQAL